MEQVKPSFCVFSSKNHTFKPSETDLIGADTPVNLLDPTLLDPRADTPVNPTFFLEEEVDKVNEKVRERRWKTGRKDWEIFLYMYMDHVGIWKAVRANQNFDMYCGQQFQCLCTLLILPFAFEDSLPDDEDAWDDGTDSDSTSDTSNDDEDGKDAHNAGTHAPTKADKEPEQPKGVPEKSAVPAQPEKIATPVEPKEPTKPEQPVKHAEPVLPAKPAEPEPIAATPGKVEEVEQAVDKSRQDHGSKAGKVVFFS